MTAAGPLTGRISDPAWNPVSGDAVRLSVRPEAWCLHLADGDNATSGTLVERSYLGQRIQYWVETAAGRQQVVEINPRRIHQPGDEAITLHARHDDVIILRP
jgi:ABC-type Fe3+/spermidine/putrescine transport system ATPase subunit